VIFVNTYVLILRFNAEFSENPARMIKTGALPPGDIIAQRKNINGPGIFTAGPDDDAA
jgi:hypothetical protein